MMDAADDSSDGEFPIVSMPLDKNSCELVVRFLIAELVRLRLLRAEDSESIVSAILHRESLGSTGVGKGVAIPHAKSSLVIRPVGIVGRCEQPMKWPGAIDSKEVVVVCLLITPAESQAGDHFRAIEGIVRKMWRDFE